MSTTESFTASAADDRDEVAYRPVNFAAIASLVFGLLSPLVALAGRDSLESALMLTPLPLLGLALGIRSLRRINAAPDAMSGRGPALAGVGLSAAFLAAGLALAGYVRVTEVPEGYAPTSFAELKPTDAELSNRHVVPPDIAALDGQKVFIKGYFRPDSSEFSTHVKEFLLVRDNNQCCFGDMSTVQFFDQVQVAMVEGKTVDYSGGLFRLGGRLRIRPENAGAGMPVYFLEADYAG
jgi:hypothetical protein